MVLSALYLASTTSLITISDVEPSRLQKEITKTRLNLGMPVSVGSSPSVMGYAFRKLEL